MLKNKIGQGKKVKMLKMRGFWELQRQKHISLMFSVTKNDA